MHCHLVEIERRGGPLLLHFLNSARNRPHTENMILYFTKCSQQQQQQQQLRLTIIYQKTSFPFSFRFDELA